MKLETLKDLLIESYGIDIDEIENKKNIYLIKSGDKAYSLKTIKYDYPHFYFILSAIIHLKNRGFENIPDIIDTLNGKKYISFDNKFCYLSPWIASRESNYDNVIELMQVTKKLAELHLSSEGFSLNRKMRPRIYWFRWIDNFQVRENEILDFKKRISQKMYKSEFDKIYLSVMEEELARIEETIIDLKRYNYFERMNKEVFKRGFCHHDYAHHNVLVTGNREMYVIDFDYCILDSSLHDLSSLIIRAMKNGKWDNKKGIEILENYNSVNRLFKDDNKIIGTFVKFPQQFWQLGIQYYWEQQPWGEEFFIDKLQKYIEDREEKEEFIKEFTNSKVKL